MPETEAEAKPLLSRLMTIKEVAELLKMSVGQIYNRRSEGRDIPGAVKVGRLLRYRRKVINAWIAAGGDAKAAQLVEHPPETLHKGH